MKGLKLILIMTALTMSFSINAAILESEVTQGMKKICIYSDGSTRTISSIGICPLTK